MKTKIYHQCIIITLITVGLMVVSGCTPKIDQSGFLSDYRKLSPDPMDKKNAMFWMDEAMPLEKYTKFILEPISFHFSPETQEQAKNVDPEVLAEISQYFMAAIKKSLSPEYTIVSQPGHDVARLRIALTSISVDRKNLQVYQYIPVALVVTAAGEATGVRDRLAVLGMEAEALDSISGKRLAAVVQRNVTEIDAKQEQDLTVKDVEPTLEFWAQKMKSRLISLK